MDKIMLQKVISLPALKNNEKKFNKDFGLDCSLSEDEKRLDVYKEYYRYIWDGIKELSDDIQIAAKFFINDDLFSFFCENSETILASKKMQQKLILPFNRPILIQGNINSSFSMLIKKISEDSFKAKFFCKNKEKDKIINFDIGLIIHEDIFMRDKYKSNYQLDAISVDFLKNPKTKIVVAGGLRSLDEHLIQPMLTLLCSFLTAMNLKEDLDIFTEQNIKGLKNIKLLQTDYSYRKFLSRPQYEHKILDVSILKNKDTESCSKNSYKNRLHEVRGHLRQLSTGKMTWVRDHFRGDASLGIITKDYNLKYGNKT